MNFYVLTIFENMFKSLDESILKKASEKSIININLIDIRKFSK